MTSSIRRSRRSCAITSSPSAVDLDDPVILRNLSEPEVGKVLFDHFKARSTR
jgi:hypothetical protein